MKRFVSIGVACLLCCVFSMVSLAGPSSGAMRLDAGQEIAQLEQDRAYYEAEYYKAIRDYNRLVDGINAAFIVIGLLVISNVAVLILFFRARKSQRNDAISSSGKCAPATEQTKQALRSSNLSRPILSSTPKRVVHVRVKSAPPGPQESKPDAAKTPVPENPAAECAAASYCRENTTQSGIVYVRDEEETEDPHPEEYSLPDRGDDVLYYTNRGGERIRIDEVSGWLYLFLFGLVGGFLADLIADVTAGVAWQAIVFPYLPLAVLTGVCIHQLYHSRWTFRVAFFSLAALNLLIPVSGSIALLSLGFSPEHAILDSLRRLILRHLVWFGAWGVYLFRSKRVRAILASNPENNADFLESHPAFRKKGIAVAAACIAIAAAGFIGYLVTMLWILYF